MPGSFSFLNCRWSLYLGRLTICRSYSHHHHLHLVLASIVFPPSPIESFARCHPNLLLHRPSGSTRPSVLLGLLFDLYPCRIRVAMCGTAFFIIRSLTIVACMNGNGPPRHHVREISALHIIAATLESIWLSHWSFVFNDTPSTTVTVLALVTKKIRQYRQESFIVAGIPHSPLPFFSVDPL